MTLAQLIFDRQNFFDVAISDFMVFL